MFKKTQCLFYYDQKRLSLLMRMRSKHLYHIMQEPLEENDLTILRAVLEYVFSMIIITFLGIGFPIYPGVHVANHII